MILQRKAYLVSMNGMGNAGGVERVVFYLNEVLTGLGWQVIILDKERINSYWLTKILQKVFGHVYGSLYPILASLYLKQYTTWKDIVVGNGYLTPFFSADVCFCHGTLAGYTETVKANDKISWGWRLICYFEKCSMRRAKTIISVSHKAAKELQKYYRVKKEKVIILNNCVDGFRFFPIKRQYNCGKVHVIFCGRLETRKGLQKLRQFAALIEGTEIHLHIACNNPENSADFYDLANTHLNVGLNIDQLNKFYNQGDIMYFPSLYEGFEMVTPEALSAGLLVLGNPVGAVGELAETGFYGVRLLNNDDILMQIRTLAAENKNYMVRKKLHDDINLMLGLDVYKEKLTSIFKLYM